jgi:hypothetical protein
MKQLAAVEQDDRADASRLGATLHGRPAVGGSGELAGLEHRVECPGALQRRLRRALPPHRPPAPDRGRRPGAAEHVGERPVGMDAVEDDRVGPLLVDELLEHRPQPQVPGPVGARARPAIGGEVVDVVALRSDGRGGLREREEGWLVAAGEAAGDRHRPVQMPEARPVAGREQDAGAHRDSRSRAARRQGAA